MVEVNRAPYGVNSQKAVQLILAGLTATAVMTAVAYLLRSAGLAAPDFGAQYGAILNGQIHPYSFTGKWWTGLLWHFVNGTFLLSFLFDYLAHRGILPAGRQGKGVLYGMGIWVAVSAVVAPLAGEGFFFRLMESPSFMVLMALVSWLVYGVVLDGMTRVRAVHYLGISEKRAA